MATTEPQSKHRRESSSMRQSIEPEVRDEPEPTLTNNPGTEREAEPVGASRSSHKKKKKNRDGQTVQIVSPKLARRMSSTEIIYPDPGTARDAFKRERANNPVHRRVPTPHSSRRTRNRSNSVNSNRSGVSGRGGQSSPSEDGGDDSDAATIGPYEPHFGAARGIGPVGKAIEVIGLGRKEPRHRKYAANLLKPALRSREPSTASLREAATRSGEGPMAGLWRARDKPLPTRPASYIVPVDSTPSSLLSPSFVRVYNQEHSQYGTAHRPGHQRSMSYDQAPSSGVGALGGLRSFWSALTLDPAPSASERARGRAIPERNDEERGGGFPPRPPFSRGRGSSKRSLHIIHPADNLYDYLRAVHVPQWSAWPGDKDLEAPNRKSIFGSLSSNWSAGGARNKGFEAMPWAWHQAFRSAEVGREVGRSMMVWESSRGWEKGVLDWLDDNVPAGQIDPENRWGNQIFALPAEGYDSLEFFDEAAHKTEDLGLLSWLTGSVLQTATSALHMLRYSSSPFTFHLIPSSPPPHHNLDPNDPKSNHVLWDGFGSLALVNKANDVDRALVIEVRPPSIVDSHVMREFAKDGRREGWWHLPGQYSVGEIGQANLLQAQVYDSCVQNQVYFFVVTNTKQWVFGYFNANYTKCQVSPVIDRKQRDPNVMQSLVAWIVRSVDERPRHGDHHEHQDLSRQPSRSGHVREDVRVFPTAPHVPQAHPLHASRSQRESTEYFPLQLPNQNTHHSYQGQAHNPYGGYSSPISPGLGEFGMNGGYGLPGYYDATGHGSMGMAGMGHHGPMGMTSPPPFPGGYNTWSGGTDQRAFSPTPYGGTPTPGMSDWYSGYGWGGMR